MYVNKITKEVMCPIDTGYGVFKKIILKGAKCIFQCNECGLIAETLEDLIKDVYIQSNFLELGHTNIIKDYKVDVEKVDYYSLLSFEEFNNKPFKFYIKKDGLVVEYFTN